MRRLYPEPGQTSVGKLVEGLDFAAMAGEDRPYVYTNFALTLDGKATISGRAGPIGSERDTELLVGLRTRAEAVMIGAQTMRTERYGRIVADPAKRARREEVGLAPDPLAVLISGRLDLPWDAPLFTEGGGRVLIFTAAEGQAPPTETPVAVVRHPDKVDLAAALAHLRRDEGVRSLLCEGGPITHAQLVDAGLVDELFVTLAPKLAGGTGPGLVVGLPEGQRPLELVSLCEEGGELFARYRAGT